MTNSKSTARGGKGDMVWGILMLICGFLAIALPAGFGIGLTIVIGWLLLVSAVWHLIFAFRAHGVRGVLWELLLALVYGAAGICILVHPLAGLAWLTLVLAIFLLVEAVLEIILFFSIRGRANAGWVLLDGIVTLVLAILIWSHWPFSTGWAIGTLVGVSLIFSGISRLMLSSSVSNQASNAATTTAS